MSIATRSGNAPEGGPTGDDDAPPGDPLASVVVPTHARPERLAELLVSLARQTLPADRFEVIVVDDGSPATARPPDPSAGGNVRLARQRRAGPAAARNRGAALARAPLLLFVDDDCTVAPDWIEAFVRAHALHPRALLGGTTVNGLEDNPWSSAAESLVEFLDAEARAAGTLDFVASNDVACARERFLDLGGFDASYPLAAGEDRAFCRAWLAAGGTIRRADEARAVHRHALDARRFWRQQHNYGRGAARFHAGARSEGRGGGRSLPRPASFYARLLLHPLARRDRPWRRRLLALPIVALSQLAVAAGAASERRAMRAARRAPDGRD